MSFLSISFKTNLELAGATLAAMEYIMATVVVGPPPMARNTQLNKSNGNGSTEENANTNKTHVMQSMVLIADNARTGRRPIL